MTYWRLHYHIVWGTYDRQPVITPELEKLFYGVLSRKADELGLKVHAAGNVDDHVHVVLSIPPKLSVAECVKHIKGASAFAMNQRPGHPKDFKWQGGYGALSVDDRSLSIVMAYASRQKEHHKDWTVIELYEQVEE